MDKRPSNARIMNMLIAHAQSKNTYDLNTKLPSMKL